MLMVHPTSDLEFIHRMIRHPDIYPSISDDKSPRNPNDLDATGYLNNCISLEVDLDDAHTLMTKLGRGRIAIKSAKDGIKWVWDNTDCKEITSYAFSDAPYVSWFCRAVGMTETGIQHNYTTRNGLPVDRIDFSLLRP